MAEIINLQRIFVKRNSLGPVAQPFVGNDVLRDHGAGRQRIDASTHADGRNSALERVCGQVTVAEIESVDS